MVISSAYGIDVKPRDDPFVEMAEKANDTQAKAGNIGSYMMDFLPALDYLPEWFPCAGFQKEAKEGAKWVKPLPDLGFRLVMKSYVRLASLNAAPPL